MPSSTGDSTKGTAGDPFEGISAARRGMVWYVAGTSVILITWLFQPWGASVTARFAPLIPMCAGAYALVFGIEKMATGVRRARAGVEAATRRRAGRLALACLLLVCASGALGAAAWTVRAPYFRAVRERNRGVVAAEKLKAIVERHTAVLQSGAGGAAALKSWADSSAAGLALRPEFAAALDGANYLAAAARGKVRGQSEVDVQYYTLCLQWMDFYEQVQRELHEVSMDGPPEAWSVNQDRIVDRIQALPAPAPEGS